jgi:hypothetical protein
MDNIEFEKLKSALKKLDSTGQKKEEVVEDRYDGLNYSVSAGTGLYSTYPSNVTINSHQYNIPTLTTSLNSNLQFSGAGPSWSNAIASSTLQIEGKDADIKINGRSLCDFMDKIEQRMSILVPDPAKLEHFEALKRAYEHYKTLEALCELPSPEENQ